MFNLILMSPFLPASEFILLKISPKVVAKISIKMDGIELLERLNKDASIGSKKWNLPAGSKKCVVVHFLAVYIFACVSTRGKIILTNWLFPKVVVKMTERDVQIQGEHLVMYRF